MAVFVLDKRQRPLIPCSEKRSSLLLRKGRIPVHKRMPLTIRLADRTVKQFTLQRSNPHEGQLLPHSDRSVWFPRGLLTRQKRIHGFATSDMVKAPFPRGKRMGAYTGRVAVRKTGSFNAQVHNGPVQGVSHKYCRLLPRADGHSYNLTPFTDSKTTGGRE